MPSTRIAVSVPPPYVAVVHLPRRVILQGEIVDETDVYVDDKKLQLAHMLRSLDPPLQQAIRTSIEMERRASLERRERYTLPEHIPCSLLSLIMFNIRPSRREGRRSLSLHEFNQSNAARRTPTKSAPETEQQAHERSQ
jgi:hypothetical protein